jgi:hypothetical protein
MTTTVAATSAARGAASDRERWLGGYAMGAAAVAVVVAPLLGLAWFATPDGADALGSASVAWWAEPARHALDPLLTWAGANRVYATYVQLVALLWPAVLLSAWHAFRRRPARTRPERVAWRVLLAGSLLMQAGLTWVSAYLVTGDPNGSAVDVPFLALMVPGTLLSTAGSTVLGCSLLRGRWTPRPTAWLLAVAFPFWFVVSIVLGHNGLGMLTMFLAWAVYGRRLRGGYEDTATPTVSAANARGAFGS